MQLAYLKCKSVLRDYELYSSLNPQHAASDLRFEILNDTFLKIAKLSSWTSENVWNFFPRAKANVLAYSRVQ